MRAWYAIGPCFQQLHVDLSDMCAHFARLIGLHVTLLLWHRCHCTWEVIDEANADGHDKAVENTETLRCMKASAFGGYIRESFSERPGRS